LVVPVSPEEDSVIRAQAKGAGLKVSRYIRYCCLEASGKIDKRGSLYDMTCGRVLYIPAYLPKEVVSVARANAEAVHMRFLTWVRCRALAGLSSKPTPEGERERASMRLGFGKLRVALRELDLTILDVGRLLLQLRRPDMMSRLQSKKPSKRSLPAFGLLGFDRISGRQVLLDVWPSGMRPLGVEDLPRKE
jgi:hypothetical protein